MPKLNVEVSHNLTQDEALKRIETLLNDVKTQFADKISDLHEEWNGHTGKFSFSAEKHTMSGTLMVKTSQVELSGDLSASFAAPALKWAIESTIKKQLKTLLA